MASIAAIRAGLAANLGTLGFKVSPYVLANPTPPVAWIRPSSETVVEYHRTMAGGTVLGGKQDWHMLVQAYVGTVADIGSQKKLDSLIDQIPALIESDRTLGGVAQDVFVEGCNGYLEYSRPDGSTVLGAEWQVLVVA